MDLYFNKAGEPIEADEWRRLLTDDSYRVIAFDRYNLMGTETWVEISTVWFGLTDGQTPPKIFETAVMNGPSDGAAARYATEAEARSGHTAMVARLIAGLASDP